MPPLARLSSLYDGGDFTLLSLPEVTRDPLRFRDRLRYSERLKEARSLVHRDEGDALVAASGTMAGHPVVTIILDFSFMGGSMGQAVGEGIVTAAQAAVAERAALLAIPASGGARMQEGILSLMQLPRTVHAIMSVKEAGLPYIVVFSNPTTGGVSASFAMLGDVALAEPAAVVGFAGPRVIQETIRESLPQGFQRSEFLFEHGMIDAVIPRDRQRAHISGLLDLLLRPRPGMETSPLESEVRDLIEITP